ncbi:GDPmannose 4,6-dehydratase [Marmoricola sp. URHA0025 HA25]
MTPRTHLVLGAGGQDGSLLVDLLVRSGERVVACVRPESARPPHGSVVEPLDVADTDGFARLVAEHSAEVVHNLAALSSVGASWSDPDRTDEVNHRSVVRMLEVVAGAPGLRFVQASSAEIFGPVATGVADEDTPLDPRSPYAESKAAAHRAVGSARDQGVLATNLVLFGHTGPRHGDGFVIPTICRQAVEVALGRRTHVELRDPTIRRDWGAARDFVRAFVLAADARADDYVIATGELHELGEVTRWALEAAGVDADVRRAPGERPADFGGVRGDAGRAARDLGWTPEVTLRDEVRTMVAACRETVA